MRTQKTFLKSTTLTAILLAVFVMGSYAQTSNDQDRNDREKRDKITQAVASTIPSDGDQDVERGTVIEITLDEEMELDQETINNSTFILKEKRSDRERERGQDMRRDQEDMQHDDDMQQQEDDMEYEDETEYETQTDQRTAQDRKQASGEDMKTIEGTVELDNNTVRFIPNQTLRAHTEYILTLNTETPGMSGTTRQQDWQQQEQDQDWDQEQDQDQDWEQEQDQTQQDRDMAQAQQQGQEWSVTFTTGGRDEPLEMVDLGSAGNYVVLANAIHNETTSDISGELGKLEGDREEGDLGRRGTDTEDAETDTTENGSGLFTDDNQQQTTTGDPTQALEDLRAAYEQVEQLSNPDFEDVFEGEISGKVLTPGLYKWNNTVEIDSVVTLSGSADEVWVFQISDDLNINEDVEIQLEDGAVPENIFWQVAGEVALRSGAHAEGVLLTMNQINLENGASVNGRMLAVNDITLDQNVITEPDMFRADRRTGRTGPEGK